MTKLYDSEGAEVEAFLPDEVKSQVETAVKTKETEFTTVKTTLEQELTEAKKALGARAGEFAQFRKLNDDVVEKLSVADRTIYENQLALKEEREKNAVAEKTRVESQVDSAIRAKAGTDDKLFGKMKDMWSVIGIDAQTPEAIDAKARMILGAISTTEPDLLASVGFKGGSWQPPETEKKTDDTIPRTDAGRKIEELLGLNKLKK